jgi:uncharacterized protein
LSSDRALLVPFLLACSCGGAGGGPVVVPIGVTSPAPAASSTAEVAPLPPRVPADEIEVTVVGVSASPDGDAVVLADPSRETFVPIAIGGTEALSIRLRFDKRRYERPLTHDLLDALLRELGGELVRVQIDDLRDDVFLATIVVRREGHFAELDARPSDAIALAIGSHVPIYMSRRVLKEAGLSGGDVGGVDLGLPPGDGGAPKSIP